MCALSPAGPSSSVPGHTTLVPRPAAAPARSERLMTSSEVPLSPEDEPAADRPEPVAAPPLNLEVEFIKATIEWAKDDVRQVYLRVTAALGIAVLVLTQLPFEKLTELDRDNLFLGALALLLGAATLHFFYLSRVHRSRRDVA